jgi:membrane-associated phospholipid phosphatase
MEGNEGAGSDRGRAIRMMSRFRQLADEANRLDVAIYRAIAETPTPILDADLRRLSGAADYSRLSLTASAVLAITGGARGRRAAERGLASVGVTAAVVNLLMKPFLRRRRPDRVGALVPSGRQVDMPHSLSFPSGHTAAAFAFATGAGRVEPWVAPPLVLVAALVGYSRVHTGVHYPGDVIAGALCGVTLAELTGVALDRLATRRA